MEFSATSNNVSANSASDRKSSFAPSRRSILKAGAAGAAVGAAGVIGSMTASASPLDKLLPTKLPVAPVADTPAEDHQVFQHGIASGDPLSNAVLLWTRITSHPSDSPGSEAGTPVRVKWEVSTTEDFSAVITSGTAQSSPATDGTIKVDATGLAADSHYYYRFTVVDGQYQGQVSPTGRTRTTPATNTAPEHLGIALTSCANWESGYFSAYRDMANNDRVDIIMCVGDYIYEYKSGEYAGKLGPVRKHQPEHEIVSLADYRLRYGTYRTDADLQEAHRVKPWIVTWDDHEIANDTYNTGADNHDPETEGDFAARRNAAIQAYLEWLPVRATTFSKGGHLYRTFNYGDLAEIVMLDLRTYRDQPPELKKFNFGLIDDESRSMLGSEQFNYLHQQWTSSSAKWNIVGNSVMFTPILIPPMDPQATAAVTELLGLPQDGLPYNPDQWDGYAAERRRLIQMMKDEGLDNIVFLTGDIHSSWACEVPNVPGRYPSDGIAAVEFVCSSVSAPNIDDIVKMPQDNPISLAATAAISGANQHVKFLEFDRHGYAAIYVGRDDITAEYRLVEDKSVPDQPCTVRATYRTVRGQGVSRA